MNHRQEVQPKPDENEAAHAAVKRATGDSAPYNAEDDLASPELQRLLREAKARLATSQQSKE